MSNTTMDLKQIVQARLEASGLPFEKVHVFGVIRLNVHVACTGADTANKWASLLTSTLKGARIHVGEHIWNAAVNKGTCMLPTMRRGYLVTAMF